MMNLKSRLKLWSVTAFSIATLCSAIGFAFETPVELSDPTKLPAVPAKAIAWSQQNPQNVYENFVTPPAGYGEVPFWWWTGDKLDKDRLEWQIERLHEKGVSGMQVNYAHKDISIPHWPTYKNRPEIFTDEWWDYYAHASKVAAKYNMGIGLSTYTLDWNNSDNLFGRIIYNDTQFNARSLQGQQVAVVKPDEKLNLQKSENHIAFVAYPIQDGKIVGTGTRISGELRVAREKGIGDQGTKGPGNAISGPSVPESLGPLLSHQSLNSPLSSQYAIWEFTYSVKPGTINPLHPQSGQRIIDKFFQPFEDHNGGKSDGLNYFFNDELNLGTHGWQWIDDFPERFAELKGYDFFSVVAALFTDMGDSTPKTRIDVMDTQVYLSEARYFKPIFMWHYTRGLTYGCDNNGRGYSPTEYHDYFRAIRWYSAPGHDTPGGSADFIKDKVSSSIANLYMRPRVWLEGYHSLGWGANPDGLMYATNENYIFGANLFNLHGLYYTTHGSFWEWAPPCYHFRMPYWKHMDVFLKYYERLSYLLCQGTWQAEIAVIYPQTPYAAGLNQGQATNCAFNSAKQIYSTNRDVAFIDDQSILRATIIEKTDTTSAKLSVSGMNFSAVVIPSMDSIHWDVISKLRQFQLAGGTVVIVGQKPVVSDRAGRNDPILNKLVDEIIQTSKQRLPNSETENKEPEAPPRTYPGCFSGYWAWASEPNLKSIQAVGTLKGLSDNPAEYNVKFFCDNHGDLYLNDKQVCSNADYANGWTGKLTLKNGDKIRIEGRDDDDGYRTAGIFFAVSDGNKTLFTTLDLKYNLNGTFKDLDQHNTHDLHRFGRKDVRFVQNSSELSQQIALFPQDVKANESIKYLHRRVSQYDVYMVMGAQKDSIVSFRSTGKPERWNPFTGQTSPVSVTEIKDGYTSVQIPVDSREACLIVFDSTKKAELNMIAQSPVSETIPMEGSWKFQLLPTMDNQWGDFRLPVTSDNKVIGAEARRMEYRTDSNQNWKTGTVGFGQRFWVSTANVDPSQILSLDKLDSSWTPYAYSWRWGIEGNPGHQGWHGLKENISDHFIGLGRTQGGHNETLYVNENPPRRYWLTTSVCYKGTVTIQKGGLLPDSVYVDGKAIPNDTKTLELTGNPQIITLSYPSAGRGFWFLEKGVTEPRQAQAEMNDQSAEQQDKAFPLAMTWYSLDVVEFNAQVPKTTEYRFNAPAGLNALTFTLDEAVTSTPRVFVDDKEVAVTSTPSVQFKTRRYTCTDIQAVKPSVVRVILPDCPLEGTAAFAEPVLFSTRQGEIDALVDWSNAGTGLEYYSGGMVYEKTVTMTKAQADKKAVLKLGDLCASAEIRVNGQSAGVLVCHPWEIDISGLLKEGENRIEIEVYNTLANHYRTVPTNYHGPTMKSGLIGPVSIELK